MTSSCRVICLRDLNICRMSHKLNGIRMIFTYIPGAFISVIVLGLIQQSLSVRDKWPTPKCIVLIFLKMDEFKDNIKTYLKYRIYTWLEVELRRITRARYHRSVRIVTREQDEIKMWIMTTDILQSNHRDLWKEVKKIKRRVNIVTASIYGLSDENDIDEFSEKNTVNFAIVCRLTTQKCIILLMKLMRNLSGRTTSKKLN